MTFQKGVVTNPKGRGKGTPNAVTAQGREAIAQFVDGNADRLKGWLDRIAEDNPKAAFDAFMSVVEYHIPKLARNEHTGKDGGDINLRVTTQDDEAIIARYLNNQQKAITHD